MGIVTPIGECLTDYLEALTAGRSGITRWKKMDERIDSKIGGDMSDFDILAHLTAVGDAYPPNLLERTPKLLRATPLSGRLTASAAIQAYIDAGLPDTSLDPQRCGHVLGGHNLNVNYIYENVQELNEDPDYIEPLFGLLSLDTDVLSVISELLNLKGPSFTLGGACASSNLALLNSLELIRAGRAEAVLVSGGAMDLDPVVLQGWAIMNALSVASFNDEPWRASRPFDARREGFVPSEGAGAIILETLESARARRAHIHAEILGVGSSSDASRLPKADMDGQMRAIRNALEDARINPEQIDYVNAHATSTPMGDRVEVATLKAVFDDHAYQIPVNSTKSMIGHCIMSAAMVELVATILQMENDVVHPTINQEETDPELDLDFVPNESRKHKIQHAISNSFGFGGLNSCVVVGKSP
jgi:3-oxoacyl-(acyl-carrier-protein) synthase